MARTRYTHTGADALLPGTHAHLQLPRLQGAVRKVSDRYRTRTHPRGLRRTLAMQDCHAPHTLPAAVVSLTPAGLLFTCPPPPPSIKKRIVPGRVVDRTCCLVSSHYKQSDLPLKRCAPLCHCTFPTLPRSPLSLLSHCLDLTPHLPPPLTFSCLFSWVRLEDPSCPTILPPHTTCPYACPCHALLSHPSLDNLSYYLLDYTDRAGYTFHLVLVLLWGLFLRFGGFCCWDQLAYPVYTTTYPTLPKIPDYSAPAPCQRCAVNPNWTYTLPGIYSTTPCQHRATVPLPCPDTPH